MIDTAAILKGAVVAALREPKVNAAFDGDAIIHYGDVNLAVAVAIDDGLVTPVIRAAQNKSLREISTAVKDLAHRARNKRMKPEEFQAGTLTVIKHVINNANGTKVGSSQSTSNSEQVSVPAGGTVRVYGYSGARNAYKLTVQ